MGVTGQLLWYSYKEREVGLWIGDPEASQSRRFATSPSGTLAAKRLADHVCKRARWDGKLFLRDTEENLMMGSL